MSNLPAVDSDRAALIAFANAAPQTDLPTLPRHVENLLALIRSHFAAARDARKWDSHDTRDYGRICLPLTGEQCRAVFANLRENHTFRPSVAEVKKAVDAVREQTDTAVLPRFALEAKRDAASIRAAAEAHRDGVTTDPTTGKKILQIVGTGESDSRQKAREMIRGLAGYTDSGKRARTERFNAAPTKTNGFSTLRDVASAAGFTPSESEAS
ncbi:MAG: hypothetical protein H7Y38_07610 [Armatimonadetes bacterium]|nr:hypothetical protein [Armatimonadota bacterium]